MKMRLQQAFSIIVRGPNKEADVKSAYNNVQVGVGPQHREFRKEILQAMRVGVGPNTEADFPPAYNNVQVGAGQR